MPIISFVCGISRSRVIWISEHGLQPDVVQVNVDGQRSQTAFILLWDMGRTRLDLNLLEDE